MKRSQNVVRIGVFYYCEYSTIGCGILGVGNAEKFVKNLPDVSSQI